MTYSKVCLSCGDPFEAKRDSARYCGEQCKNDWHAENRAASSEVQPQRVERHVLDEVRGLMEEHKGDWTLIIREYARRTLLSTGYLSAADFTILGVPAEHCNLPGAQIGAFAGAGYMEAVTFKRWSAEAKASRKSGKYWVYRITTKGKEKLSSEEIVGLSAAAQLKPVLGGPAGDGRSTEPGDPRSTNSEGNQSISPVGSLDRPGGPVPLPPDGAESSDAATGAGTPSRSESATSSPPAVEVAAGTGSSPASSPDEQLVETLCEEFDAQLIEEQPAVSETLFGEGSSMYGVEAA